MILPPGYFFAHLLAMLALHVLWPGLRWISAPWSYLGALPAMAGVIVVLVAARWFGKYQTTLKPFDESTILVLAGPYLYSRNPMYGGMLLILAGTAILLGSLTPLGALPSFFWLITTRFIVREERDLERRFGQDYLDYKKRVRRWI